MTDPQNIPNTSQRTVQAYMKVKSFISPQNPTPEQMEKYDQEIIDFLATIDNLKRFLNGRNAFALGDRLYALVWYLESIPNEPVSQPFGEAVTEEKEKSEQNPSTPQTENK